MPREFSREQLIKEFEEADAANQKRQYNFTVHGKRLEFAKHALFVFKPDNRFRKAVVWLTESKQFSWCILAVIVVNSALLGFSDYLNSDGYNTLLDNSWRNHILLRSEPVFTAIFAAEAALKIVAMGFVLEPNTYLRDKWNILDFVVVVSALLASVPDVPNVSILRAFRVLRPLRSLSLLPGMRVLVNSLLVALPALFNVLLLTLFIFAVFGILGVQLLLGTQHGRCRLTELPVTFLATNSTGPCSLPYSEACQAAILHENGTASGRLAKSVWSANLNMHVSSTVNDAGLARCVDGEHTSGTSKSSSVWAQARNCFWPLDTNDALLCSLPGSSGRSCGRGRWCGSDYDAFGNPKFTEDNVLDAGTFVPELNFGFTTFDNFFKATLTIFQSITLEGWSDIMYQLMDAYNPVFGVVFMVALVLIGAFFTVNLMLSVIWSSFEESRERELAREEFEDRKRKGWLTHHAVHQAGTVADAAKAFSSPGPQLKEESGGGSKRLRIAPRRSDRSRQALSDEEPEHRQGGIRRKISSFVPHSFRARLLGSPDPVALSSDQPPLAATPALDPNSFQRAWRRLQTWCARIVAASWFGAVVGLLIFANAVVLTCDHYPSSRSYAERLEIANFALTIAFVLDLLLKLIGLGPRQYFTDNMNKFDFVVVVMSVVEQGLVPPSFFTVASDRPQAGSFSVFRVFRLFRLIRLVRIWTSLNDLVDMILQTLSDVMNIALLLCLLMYIFALLGMQLFATRFCFDDGTHTRVHGQNNMFCRPRSNFDKLPNALATVFQLLTTENWNVVMYDAWRAVGWPGVLYFVVIIVVGYFIALNLFLAILLENFEELGNSDDVGFRVSSRLFTSLRRLWLVLRGQTSSSMIRSIVSGAQQTWTALSMRFRSTFGTRRTLPSPARSVHPESPGSPEPLLGRGVRRRADAPPVVAQLLPESPASHAGEAKLESIESCGDEWSEKASDPNDDLVQKVMAEAYDVPVAGVPSSTSLQRAHSPELPRPNFWPQLFHTRTLFLFGPSNPLRAMSGRVVSTPSFEWLILSVILYSCVMLVLDSPLIDPGSHLAAVLGVSDVVVTSIFVFEFVVKVIANGLLFGDHAYLKSWWNCLDFVIVVVSIASLAVGGGGSLNAVKAIRALRALRPLRVITKFPALRLSVDALLSAIPSVVSVLVVASLFFVVFGVVCVQYFKGALLACQGSGLEDVDANILQLLEYPVPYGLLNADAQAYFAGTSYATFDGPLTGRVVCDFLAQAVPAGDVEWAPTTSFNFDNIFEAVNTLLQVSTTEGWMDLAYACADSRGIDQQPIRDHGFHWVFFFVLFEVVMSFFVMKLFAGVIIESFQKRKRALGDGASLTPSQKEWTETRKFMREFAPLVQPPVPKHPLRGPVFRMLERHGGLLDKVVLVCIIGNTAVLAMPYFGANDSYLAALDVLNIVFVIVFGVEAMLKLVAYGNLYWRDSWNVFDFAIVIGSFIGILVSTADAGPVVSTVRLFRIMRVFRLVKRLRTLNILFQTLTLSLPGVANIAALLVLFLFIYAAIGVQLFAPVMLRSSLNEHANFQTFGTAMLTLFRGTTGEGWDYIMADLAAVDATCDPNLLEKPWSYRKQFCGFSHDSDCLPINGCGVPWAAQLYYQSFTLLITNIFMGLFAVFILEGFAVADREASAVLSKAHLHAFQQVWQKYDPQGHGLVHFKELRDIIRALPPPLGFQGTRPTERQLRQLFKRMPVRLYRRSMVTFWEVAKYLAIIVYEDDAKRKDDSFLPAGSKLLDVETQRLTSRAKSFMKAYQESPTLQMYFAADAIQRAFRMNSAAKRKKSKTKFGSSTTVVNVCPDDLGL